MDNSATVAGTEETRIGIPEKLGFGGFALSCNMVYQFKGMYFLFFLTNALKLQPVIAGLIITLGMVWDGVNDPLLGYYAINHRFKSGEMSRPFALWFAPLVAVVFILIFTVITAPSWVRFAWALVWILVFETVFTLNNIPYHTMPTLATGSEADRISISLFVTGGAGLGVALGAIVCFPLVKLFGGLDSGGNLVDGRGFTWAAAVVAVICVLGSFSHYFTSRERIKPINNSDDKIAIKAAFKMLFKCDSWVKNMLFNLLYTMSNIFVTSSIAYYTTYVLRKTSVMTPLLIGYIVGSFVPLPIIGIFHRRFGRRATMVAGALFYICGKIWFIVQPFSFAAALVNSFTIGVGATFCFSMLIINRADTVDLIEWSGGRRIDSLVGTTMTFATKCASALCSFLIGLILQVAKYDATIKVQPAGAVKAITALLGWIPLVFGFILLLVAATMNIEAEVDAMNEGKKARGLI